MSFVELSAVLGSSRKLELSLAYDCLHRYSIGKSVNDCFRPRLFCAIGEVTFQHFWMSAFKAGSISDDIVCQVGPELSHLARRFLPGCENSGRCNASQQSGQVALPGYPLMSRQNSTEQARV